MKAYLSFFICIFLGFQGLNAQKLKLMSYNIHIGKNAANEDQLKNIADFIKNSKADLIGLQEVDSVCNRSGKIDQMKFLAEQTGMYYAYARHFAFDGGSYGLGILSRFPLSDIINNRISLTSEGKSDTRALLTASVFSGRRKFTFATVHLDYRDSNSRQKQASELVDFFVKSPRAVILTGDMNAKPGTLEILKLETLFTETGPPSGATYPVIKPLNKIDYIMVDSAYLLKVQDQEVVYVLFSDHLPLRSTVRIRKRTSR